MSLFSAYILLLWSQHFAVSGKKHNTLRNRYEKYPLEIHFLRKNLEKIWKTRNIFESVIHDDVSAGSISKEKHKHTYTRLITLTTCIKQKIFLLENVFSLEWILGGSNCCCIVFNNCYFHDESTLALSECSSKCNNRYWSLFNENACLFSKHDYAFIVITDFFTVTKICFLAIKGKGESM